MATINDVASRAGVSTATVSRVLNGKSTVDPKLAARVQAAARELRYRPNGPARNLRRQEAAVLALIISDVGNPFYTSIARGVEDVAQGVGYSVVLCNADEDADKERRYIDVAIQERVAGVIISPTPQATSVDLLINRGTPLVAVDRPLPDRPSDTVLVDTRVAAREATEHLLAQGYTRIGCITGPAGVRTADDRLAGYRDALGSAGAVRRVEFTERDGARACASLLDEERPDALLAANNALAIGVLSELRERSLRAGADIGVVAFDDVPWAGVTDPPLSVVAQPAYEIGAEAARLLLARVGDGEREAVTRVLGARLIERASSRRAG